MNPRIFSLYGGIAMIVLGLIAFFAPGSVEGLIPLSLNYSHGLFFDLIPMNIANKAALIVLGLAGVACNLDSAVSLPRSIWYSRVVALLMAVLMVAGLFPATNTLFGYWPLYGADVWLHAAVAAIAGFYGFALSSRVPADRTGRHLNRESLVTH